MDMGEAMASSRFTGGQAIDVPVTVAYGDKDKALLKRHRTADELPPHTRWLTLPRCGHVPMADDPRLVANTILAGGQRVRVPARLSREPASRGPWAMARRATGRARRLGDYSCRDGRARRARARPPRSPRPWRRCAGRRRPCGRPRPRSPRRRPSAGPRRPDRRRPATRRCGASATRRMISALASAIRAAPAPISSSSCQRISSSAASASSDESGGSVGEHSALDLDPHVRGFGQGVQQRHGLGSHDARDAPRAGPVSEPVHGEAQPLHP